MELWKPGCYLEEQTAMAPQQQQEDHYLSVLLRR
jgi:hypothetical protein